MNTKIVIAVAGGVVQGVRSNNANVDIEVFDMDNLKEEGKTSKQLDRIWETKERNYPYESY